jgi:hypothetical protein
MKKIIIIGAAFAALTFTACGTSSDSNNTDKQHPNEVSDSLKDGSTLRQVEKAVGSDYLDKWGITVKHVGCVPESESKATCLVEFREPDEAGETEQMIELTWDGNGYVWDSKES